MPSAATRTPAIRRTPDFSIVGIGASAGGLEAVTALLKHLPAEAGMAFVLVQHLDPTHDSALTQILSSATPMAVREVSDGLAVEPNHIYVIPPNKEMSLVGGVLRLAARPKRSAPARSIDAFLESLALDRSSLAIGVILSGTASDGTLGLEAIKAEGGITFAQDESARYDSMPRSAIAAGCVDFVLSPGEIAKHLARLGRQQSLFARSKKARPASSERVQPESEDDLQNVLILLHNHSGVDFSRYKTNTVQRRISRRMLLSGQESLAGYARFLRGNAAELDALHADMLIGVTSFNRNAPEFEVLKKKIFPKLLQRRADEPVRIWVPGCSTGQEAYSLAMAFAEACGDRPGRLQVFATDLNEAVLEKARQGLYPQAALADVSAARLRRFFTAEPAGYRVSKRLREACVFARQNVITDPPFSRMDLVSCRNLLIYLDPSLQKRILPAFHYALKPGGFLFLGMSETIGGFGDLFEAVNGKHKIFAKKPALGPAFRLPYPDRAPVRQRVPEIEERPSRESTAQREADRIAVTRFAPPGVLVDSEMKILQFRGDSSAYLKQPAGRASFDLLKMTREGLVLPLRRAVEKARRHKKSVRVENVPVGRGGPGWRVNLEVVPLRNIKEVCYLILFEAIPEPVAPASGVKGGRRAGAPAPAAFRRLAELERELAEARDFNAALQESNDAATEEAQAQKEELQSANEELQSINEEMETSKEELESANEELSTVNDEMASRYTELTRLNGDLQNLTVSLHIPVLVLARDLAIRRFTPPAEKLFNLLGTDVGRPLGATKSNLDCPDLEQLVAESIDTVSVRERDVRDKDGHWYLLRIRPYMSVDRTIDGAVLLLIDIDALKRGQAEITAARDFAEGILQTTHHPLVVLGADLRVRSANSAYYAAFKSSADRTEGHLIREVDHGQWNHPQLGALLGEIVEGKKTAFEDVEVTREFRQFGPRTILASARALETASGNPTRRILLALNDVTESKALLKIVEERSRSLQEALAHMEEFNYSVSHDLRAPLRAMQGYARIAHDEYGPLLGDAGRECLQRIINASLRMERLTEDLLAYSKMARVSLPREPVSLENIIRDVILQHLQMRSPRAGITVESPLLPVLGHPSALIQVISNLLGNAVKFVAEGVVPRVRIWTEARDGIVRCWIEDNGIGILPEHQSRIFGMFERIHTRGHYEGTGIGLAIVRKAVERMGGKVGLESDGKTGSRFWFELARA